MYAPVIKSAHTRKRYKFGRYEAAFLDRIVSEEIGYEFIIVVFEGKNADPFLFVTSERNDSDANAESFRELGLDPETLSAEKSESHFLCLFDKHGHHNFGDSNDWGDAEKFEVAALRILTEQLGEAPIVV